MNKWKVKTDHRSRASHFSYTIEFVLLLFLSSPERRLIWLPIRNSHILFRRPSKIFASYNNEVWIWKLHEKKIAYFDVFILIVGKMKPNQYVTFKFAVFLTHVPLTQPFCRWSILHAPTNIIFIRPFAMTIYYYKTLDRNDEDLMHSFIHWFDVNGMLYSLFTEWVVE